MADERGSLTVAVLNNSEEVVEFLRLALESDGYLHVSESVLTFRRGEREIEAFIEEHNPRAIIWDIGLPYDENWEFFCRVRDSGALDGRGIVLTTTNKRALEQFVGPTPSLELLGKPYDLDQILTAVRRSLERVRSA